MAILAGLIGLMMVSTLAPAATVQAKASLKKGQVNANDSQGGKFINGKGQFVVGVTQVGKDSEPSVQQMYSAGGLALPAHDVKANAFGTTTGDAVSKMTVGALNKGYYTYTAEAKVTLKRTDARAPNMGGRAHVKDPQYFDPAGFVGDPILEMEVTVGAGTGLYTTDSEGFSSMYSSVTTSLLAEPIFSFSGYATTMETSFDLVFNTHPAVSFSVSETALEAMLQDPSFYTETGLAQDVVFSYFIDTSYFALTEDDWLGSIDSVRAGVPEPAAILPLLLTFALQRRRRR
ncbi:MAG TPA: hypothetical protein P5572_04320 [Phycisphaerae bacterium]|nr:hypothetical protein [Phycisphaerae bacterium]